MLETLKNKTYRFLHWTEKWTKTDMVYFAKGGFWLTLSRLVSIFSAFLLSVAFANLLPKEIYGNYKYILSLAGLLSIPTLSGMGTALTQAVAKGFEGSFLPTVKTRIKWGLIGGGGSLILAGYYFFYGNTTFTFSFLIAAIFLPFMDPLNSFDSVLVGKKLFKTSTKYDITIKIVATIGMIGTIFLTKNILLIILSYFTIYTFLRLIFLKITLHRIKLNDRQDERTISYGKHLSLMDIISAITSQLDKILVFNYLGAAELSIYVFAIAMPEQMKGLLKNVYTLALPKFTQSDYQENRKSILIKMLRFSLVLSPVIIIYILTAPFLFRWLFPQYLDSIFYSQIFSISLLSAANSFPIAFLQSQRAQKKLYQYNIYSPAIQIIFLFVFIYFFGLMGMIAARVINRFINLSFAVMLVDRKK